MSSTETSSFFFQSLDLIMGFALFAGVYYFYNKYIKNNFNSELDALIKLKTMLDEGLINETKYNGIRSKILKKLN